MKDISNLKNIRVSYGVTQNRLATQVGITREYLSRIENKKVEASEELTNKLFSNLEQLNPEANLTMCIDYLRIRFPTTNAKHIIEDILQLKVEYMLFEDYGFYSYDGHFLFGNIMILTSNDIKKGTLLELKGQGCREFENFLLAQHRSWFDFLLLALKHDGVLKRLDLAINDITGVLNIPSLINKCKNGECISVFKNFKSYRSGELVQHNEKALGNTLYIGSLSSDIYFCVYEKDYEQLVKNGVAIDKAPIKNRFEIRLKNQRAYNAVVDLLTYRNAERTAFSIINRYVKFVDRENGKRRSEWKINPNWAWFIGDNRNCLKLTIEPSPFSFDKVLNWLNRQVAPTLKVVLKIDELNNTNYIKDMLNNTKLSERHEKIILQQTADINEVLGNKK